MLYTQNVTFYLITEYICMLYTQNVTFYLITEYICMLYYYLFDYRVYMYVIHAERYVLFEIIP